jgi:hypothetical protein
MFMLVITEYNSVYTPNYFVSYMAPVDQWKSEGYYTFKSCWDILKLRKVSFYASEWPSNIMKRFSKLMQKYK